MTSKLWKSHLFWYAAETSRLLRPKGAYVFNLWYQYIILALKVLPFQHVCYCDLPFTNPAMVILQIMFAKTFLFTHLVWQYLFFRKIMIFAFTVIGSSTFCHGTTTILLSTNPTFCQIYYFLIFYLFDELCLKVYF